LIFVIEVKAIISQKISRIDNKATLTEQGYALLHQAETGRRSS
jgi:hypothetical protein